MDPLPAVGLWTPKYLPYLRSLSRIWHYAAPEFQKESTSEDLTGHPTINSEFASSWEAPISQPDRELGLDGFAREAVRMSMFGGSPTVALGEQSVD